MNDPSKSIFLQAGNCVQHSSAGYISRQVKPGAPAPFSETSALYAVHDEWLAASAHALFVAPAAMQLLLVPLTGAIGYTGADGIAHRVESGTARVFQVEEKASCQIDNWAGHEPVRYLQYRLQKNNGACALENVLAAEAEHHECHLHVLCSYGKGADLLTLSLGLFKGRDEAEYTLAAARNKLFVFVVQGAFEVQHRLLEVGDSMFLWELAKVEIEALSNGAVLLLLELGCAG